MNEISEPHRPSPSEKDAVDRILRRRVSEETLTKIIRLMGVAYQDYLNARLQPITPDLKFRFVADDRPWGHRAKGGTANCAAFTFSYDTQRARVWLTLERDGFNIASGALLGSDPEMPIARFDSDISDLELRLLQAMADVIARSRKSAGPLMAFRKVAIVRGDDETLEAGPQDALAALTFEIAFGVNRAYCWLNVPHKLLLELAAQMAQQEANAERRRMPDRFNVPDFQLEIEAVLPLAPMTLQSLALLQPGMVLEAAPTGGRATLRTCGRDLYHADVGRMGQMHAVQVVAPFGATTAVLKELGQKHKSKKER